MGCNLAYIQSVTDDGTVYLKDNDPNDDSIFTLNKKYFYSGNMCQKLFSDTQKYNVGDQIYYST